MSNRPQVSFIICTYNRSKYLDDAIKSLFRPDLAEVKFELLIIDNNSHDQTPEIVQKHQNIQNVHPIRYIKEQKQGLSNARNRGIKEAMAEHIVFLDDDIRATSTLIPAWISFFTEHPNAVAGGGKIHVQFDDPRPDWLSHFLLPLIGHHDIGNSIKNYPEHKYPFGGNMGFNKSIFEKAGLFDTQMGRKGKSLNAGAEKEFFHRIKNQYNEIYYLPDAFLYHRVNKHRLTVDYIRRQALGLGHGMKLQLEDASNRRKLFNWLSEAGKLLASVPLAIGYILTLNFSKARMLFRFRRWIWRGYRKL